MRLLITLLILFGLKGFSQTYTVKTVPNTKLVNNNYVSNPDGILDDYTVSEINSILGSLESQTTAQVTVVAIQSIGDDDIFDFAQSLFNEWGIGQAKEDNGLLILLVMDKRTIRLHTGYGLEGDLPDIICKHIETQKMVPHFKDGDFNLGIIEGVREVNRILTNAEYSSELKSSLETADDTSSTITEEYSDPIRPSDFLSWVMGVWLLIMIILFFYNRSKGIFNDSPTFKSIDGPNIKTGSIHFLVWFIVIPLGVFIASYVVDNFLVLASSFYGYLFLGATETRIRLNSAYHKYLPQKEYHRLYLLYQEKLSLWKWAAFIIPIPFAFLYWPYKKRMTFLREHPRDCGQCGKPTSKLNEQTEDPFLNKQQQFEEQLKSVDYDVWKCNDCGAAQVFRYPNPSTSYEDCPKCSTVAYYVSSTRTIRAATESSEGLKEETKLCKFCKFKNVRTYTTPKLSSSSSDSGGGSSGGSWGGGSSGGGGASSSW